MSKEFPEYTEGKIQEELRSWRNIAAFVKSVDGDITASVTGRMLGLAEKSGKIRAIDIALRETGADTSNALSIEVDVKKNGTSIFDAGTTKPTLSKADADYSHNRVELTAGTDTEEFEAGDVFTFDATLTRTTSPDTEMADLMVKAEIYT